MNGSDPNKTALHLAHAHDWEVIAQQFVAMGSDNTNIILVETLFTKIVRIWEKKKLDDMLVQLTTDTKVDATTYNIIHYAINIL